MGRRHHRATGGTAGRALALTTFRAWLRVIELLLTRSLSTWGRTCTAGQAGD
ncbi:MAG: hypothetical protein ACI8PT_000990 [Gammaproteobacteria bacterium]|jgi:hypothetical protein